MVDNEVWEDPNIVHAWRNSIYSEEKKDTPHGVLFTKEIKFFQDISDEVKKSKNYARSALVEVGFGTGELFSKVDKNFDVLLGVELSQSMIDLALEIHPKFNDINTNVKLL